VIFLPPIIGLKSPSPIDLICIQIYLLFVAEAEPLCETQRCNLNFKINWHKTRIKKASDVLKKDLWKLNGQNQIQVKIHDG